MPPISADVGKAVPLPRTFSGLLRGVQSIEIKYFQEHIFGEYSDRYPPPILVCAA